MPATTSTSNSTTRDRKHPCEVERLNLVEFRLSSFRIYPPSGIARPRGVSLFMERKILASKITGTAKRKKQLFLLQPENPISLLPSSTVTLLTFYGEFRVFHNSPTESSCNTFTTVLDQIAKTLWLLSRIKQSTGIASEPCVE